MKAVLPAFLQFHAASDLIRLGRNNDGGYLVSKADIEASDMLFGLGINDDWSFEVDFCAINDVPLLAYDASVGRAWLLRKFARSFIRFSRHATPYHMLRKYLSYREFFTGKRRHVRKFVGLKPGDDFCTMQSIFGETDAKRIFCKIDIEGSEYDCLDTLVENLARLAGIAIEFHDCDRHLDEIEDFVDRLAMPLVHIHANNYALPDSRTGIPPVLEMTFSANAVLEEGNTLPHPCDMPNKRRREEIELTFAD